MSAPDVPSFIERLDFEALPDAVVHQAERCVLDLIGTAACGVTTRLSAIIRDHACTQFASPGHGARLLFDGRRASPVGAALAGGMTIDSFDAHDGHVLTKGHSGAAVLPALLALADMAPREMTGRAFLATVVLGYEIAIRAGIATHRTAQDYHTSGAWNALGAAAVTARLLQLDAAGTRHALGIAEYHGPRSPMMRCIAHPTMVKDSSGWGAMTGVSAALLATEGFTGAPAAIVEDGATADLWSDLGQRWRILELYFKPYPVCRWAQPAIEAALQLRDAHALRPERIAAIEVSTFREAAALAVAAPASTEEAQYSLPFPLAAALVRGRLAATEIDGAGLADPAVLALSRKVRLVEDPALSALFPAQRLARVVVTTVDGSSLASANVPARGDAESPLSDSELHAKYKGLAGPVLGRRRAEALARAVGALAQGGGVRDLLDLLLSLPEIARTNDRRAGARAGSQT